MVNETAKIFKKPKEKGKRKKEKVERSETRQEMKTGKRSFHSP
jgi:hypothetical protein